MTKYTKNSLARTLGISPENAYLLLRFGVAMGWVTQSGTTPSTNGKGRSANVYTYPDDFGDRLKALWDKRLPSPLEVEL